MMSTDPLSVVSEILPDVQSRLNRDYEEASAWVSEIISNTDRKKMDYCEICERRVVKEDMQIHHIAGEEYGDWTITACIKCHDILTRKEKSWDRKWNVEFNEGDSEYFLLRGLIDVLELKSKETDRAYYRDLANDLRNKLVIFRG